MSEYKARRYYLDNLANEYRHKNAQLNIIHMNDVKRLNHDMKNHLLVIKNYLLKDKSNEALTYVEKMIDTQDEHTSRIHTGREILDGILNDKER